MFNQSWQIGSVRAVGWYWETQANQKTIAGNKQAVWHKSRLPRCLSNRVEQDNPVNSSLSGSLVNVVVNKVWIDCAGCRHQHDRRAGLSLHCQQRPGMCC
jgi:hypothetical protein